jgi:hypothetical protein
VAQVHITEAITEQMELPTQAVAAVVALKVLALLALLAAQVL